MKLCDLIIDSARKSPKRVACISGAGAISYRQLMDQMNILAKKLKYVGCRRGAKIALVLDNSIEYLIAFFAISAARGTIVPLSGKMTAYEISPYICQADAHIIITNKTIGNKISKKTIMERAASIVYIKYCTEKKLDIDIKTFASNQIEKENDDLALLVPTSGSSGPNKLVMLTNENLISNMHAYKNAMHFKDHHIVYCALSMHYIYCICAQILPHVSRADTFILNEQPFLIKEFLQTVSKRRVSISAFVPYMAARMAACPGLDQFNLKSLKYITLSGAKTPLTIYKTLKTKYQHIRFVNMYGMTEAGSRIALAMPPRKKFPDDSVGAPAPGVSIKIINQKGEDLPPHTTGQVIVKSSGVMKGYYKQPQLTKKTLINGWLHTGDLGHLDERGNLFLSGRIKDIINSGGYNVNPLEIEQCLLKHPSIAQAAVVAKKDKTLQEVPCVFVTQKHPPKNLSPKNILTFCRNKLSAYKVPRYVVILDKLPILAGSKINKNLLRKMAADVR